MPTLYDANGNVIEISGSAGSSVSLTGNKLKIDQTVKCIPAVAAKPAPVRSNIVSEAAYSDAGDKVAFTIGLRFRNPKRLTTITFDYSVNITGSCSVVSTYLAGDAGNVLAENHAYSGGEMSFSDTFSDATKLNVEYLSLNLLLATSNTTTNPDKIATARTLKMATVPDGLEFVGLSVGNCPTLTKNKLTFDEEPQYERYVTKWSGKRYMAFGDSVTQGVAPYWVKVLGSALGCAETVNNGVGGTTMTYLAPRFANYAYQGFDLVTIAHGINDYHHTVSSTAPGSPLGTLMPHGSTFDITTYIGATQYIVETIKSNSPKTEICLIAPIYYKLQTGVNDRGLILEDYRVALRSVAESYGLMFINGEDVFGSDLAYMLSDNVHPNAEGHEYLGLAYADILANM